MFADLRRQMLLGQIPADLTGNGRLSLADVRALIVLLV